MPVEGIVPRLPEQGRIRLGEIGESRDGKAIPSKLETFRLTSPDHKSIEVAAKIYGGEPEPWTSPDGEQWQVTTEASELDVLVPPQSVTDSQWYELWKAGGRLRMCNGVQDFHSGGPCLCDPENRECKLTTQLLVLLPQLPGIGTWRLVTRGYNAAVEIPGALAVLDRLRDRTGFAVATLAAERRTQKVPGEAERQFVVPTLRVPYALSEVGFGASPTRALEPGEVLDLTTGEITASPVEPGVEAPGRRSAGVPSSAGAEPSGGPETTGSAGGSSPPPQRGAREAKSASEPPAQPSAKADAADGGGALTEGKGGSTSASEQTSPSGGVNEAPVPVSSWSGSEPRTEPPDGETSKPKGRWKRSQADCHHVVPLVKGTGGVDVCGDCGMALPEITGVSA